MLWVTAAGLQNVVQEVHLRSLVKLRLQVNRVASSLSCIRYHAQGCMISRELLAYYGNVNQVINFFGLTDRTGEALAPATGTYVAFR
jgi:hypothetical protein